MLQLFPSISHLIRPRQPDIYLSLLTPSILCHDDFHEIAHHSPEKLKRIQEIVQKVCHDHTLTRMKKQWFIKRWSRRNSGGSKKSHCKCFYCQYGRQNGKWPKRECQETHSGPWHVGQNGSRRSQDNLKLSKKLAKVGDQTVFLWDEEGAIQDLQGVQSDGSHGSLTVLDNFLTLWEAAGGRRASWPASFSLRRPPGSAETGVREIARRRTSPRCSGGNKSAAWSAWRSPATILRKAKNRK